MRANKLRPPLPPTWRLALTCILALACLLPGRLAAQDVPPGELVQQAIRNQIQDTGAKTNAFFSWRQVNFHDHSRQTEEQVQTPSGTVNRILLIDDKPLTPEQQAKEAERQRAMLSPERMSRKQKEDSEDDERSRKMLAAIPNAFDFYLLGSSEAPNGHRLAHIKFTPRPGFDPPSRETAILTGMQGEMVIDQTAQRLVKIDAVLTKEVNFGWGILGRLYKGGKFYVEQAEVTPAHWDTTHMTLHFDGKALLLKSIHIDENESLWDFKPVPPMSVEQALEYLNHDEATTENAMLSR